MKALLIVLSCLPALLLPRWCEARWTDSPAAALQQPPGGPQPASPEDQPPPVPPGSGAAQPTL